MHGANMDTVSIEFLSENRQLHGCLSKHEQLVLQLATGYNGGLSGHQFTTTHNGDLILQKRAKRLAAVNVKLSLADK